MSDIISRIKQVIEYKGISERKFSSEIGVSNGFLNKVSDVGCSKLNKIVETYPEINPTWLLTGNGEMIESIRNTQENPDIELSSDIISNIRQIRYLYQRIVDVNILIEEYLKIKEQTDYTGDAAEIMNNLILAEHGLIQWKEFDLNEKKLYNQKLKEAVRLLQDMFFERFKLLYNKMRGFK